MNGEVLLRMTLWICLTERRLNCILHKTYVGWGYSHRASDPAALTLLTNG